MGLAKLTTTHPRSNVHTNLYGDVSLSNVEFQMRILLIMCRLSWHYNSVGPSESMEEVEDLIKMRHVSFSRVWSCFYMKTFLQGATVFQRRAYFGLKVCVAILS